MTYYLYVILQAYKSAVIMKSCGNTALKQQACYVGLHVLPRSKTDVYMLTLLTFLK
jgi:hypothetical protein